MLLSAAKCKKSILIGNPASLRLSKSLFPFKINNTRENNSVCGMLNPLGLTHDFVTNGIIFITNLDHLDFLVGSPTI